MSSSEGRPSAGTIYDLGYRHYTGPRLGRRGAIWSLYLDGLRALFGLGRGHRAKIAPVVLTGFMVVPALIQVGIVALLGPIFELFTHADYFKSTLWVFALFCALQTPELVTQDVQHRVLALYFSRALRPRDYILARLASLVTGIGAVALAPHLVLLIGRCLAATDLWTTVLTSISMLPRLLLSVLLVALLLGSVAMMIAALVRRRPLATVGILASWLLAYLFVSLVVWRQPQRLRPLVFASPLTVAQGLSTWTLDPGPFEVKSPSRQDSLPPPPSPVAATAPSDSVPTDSVPPRSVNARQPRQRPPTLWQAIGWPGWVYLGGAALMILVSGLVLDRRYRQVDT